MAINAQVDTFTATAQTGVTLGASGEGESWTTIEVTGVFTGTISVFGALTATGVTAALPIAVANMNAPGTFVTTITAPGVYKAEITGLLYYYLKTTGTWTSGTAVAAHSLSSLGGGS